MTEEVIETILSSRYYLENEHSWEDVCKRVSNFVGNTDEERSLFFEMMKERRGIPNSPCLFNAGTENPQMSACFVLDLEDSIDSIYKLLWDSARIMKSGGGFGVNLSKISSLFNGLSEKLPEQPTEDLKYLDKKHPLKFLFHIPNYSFYQLYISCASKFDNFFDFLPL